MVHTANQGRLGSRDARPSVTLPTFFFFFFFFFVEAGDKLIVYTALTA